MTAQDKIDRLIRALRQCIEHRSTGSRVRVIAEDAIREVDACWSNEELVTQADKYFGPTTGDLQSPAVSTIREEIAANEAAFMKKHLPKFTAPKSAVETKDIIAVPVRIDRTDITPSRMVNGWQWDCPWCGDTIHTTHGAFATRKDIEESGHDPRCDACQNK